MVSLRYALLCWFALPVHGSWVDPDTPEDVQTIDPWSPGDEREYELVSSFLHCQLLQFLWTVKLTPKILRSFRMSSNKMVGRFTMEMILGGQHLKKMTVRFEC
jgi:hypothetical protein